MKVVTIVGSLIQVPAEFSRAEGRVQLVPLGGGGELGQRVQECFHS